jgi:hypothetical protein
MADQNFVLMGVTVAAMSIGTDANAPNESLSPPADKS